MSCLTILKSAGHDIDNVKERQNADDFAPNIFTLSVWNPG